MGRSPGCDENGLKKGPWTPEEDEKLVHHISKHGYGSWRALPKLAGLNRCGKSCRLRWTNYLRPDIKRGKFSQEEEQTILNLHSILGNKWSSIATHLPGRTDNEIKNFWNTHLRKKLIQMGFDPMTHQPRTDHHLFASLPTLFALANLRDHLINMHSSSSPSLSSSPPPPQIMNHIDSTLHYLLMIQSAASTNSYSPESGNYNVSINNDNMDVLTNFLNSNLENDHQVITTNSSDQPLHHDHDHDHPIISPFQLPQLCDPQVPFSSQSPHLNTTTITRLDSEKNNHSGSLVWSNMEDPSPSCTSTPSVPPMATQVPADTSICINPGDASSTTTSSYGGGGGGGVSYWPELYFDDSIIPHIS